MLSVSMPDHPEKVQEMVDENERKKTTDQLQQELRTANQELNSRLFYNVPVNFHKDAKFVKAAASAAHLTKEEVKK
jgi:uncharacterized protein YdhG (YjbR/CyaY superfamily)